MTPTKSLLSKLENVRRNGQGWIARCPAHDDRSPSLSISEGDDGRALVYCHAGCTVDDICAAIGIETSALFVPDGNGHTEKPRSASTPPTVYRTAEDAIAELERSLGPRTKSWTYTDASGEPIGVVVRWDRTGGKKDIRPVARSGEGWIIGGMVAPRPLYRLVELGDAETIYVCEGEKAADAAVALGLTATTSSQGSGSAHLSDWTVLAGKNIVIMPDADEKGEKYSKDIGAILSRLKPQPEIKIVDLPGLPEGGDIVELIEDRRMDAKDDLAIRTEIEDLAKLADSFLAPIDPERARNESWTPIPASALRSEGGDVEWVWYGYAARRFVTLLTALWKAGKTTMLCHLLHEIDDGGHLATDVARVKALVVSEEPASLWARRRDKHGFSDSIHFITMPFMSRPGQQKYEKFVRKLETHVKREEYGLVILDTLVNVSPCDNENDAAKMHSALMPLRQITEAGAALILVHHNRKGDGTEGQASRGSGALPGFVDIIVEFRRHEPENHDDTRRTLTTFSRFEETPKEVVLELREEGYVVVGSKADAKQKDRFEIIEDILRVAEGSLTRDAIHVAWTDRAVARPGKRTLDKDLKSGYETGMWDRSGEGVKGNPFTYKANS